MYNLCLIAIFKNESHILREWINHYLNQGVQKFFLIDNGSTDNYYSIIEPFIIKKIIFLVRDDKPHSQIELYNKYFLNICKRYKWAIICDLDEFIYARRGFKKITGYLQYINNYKHISQIFIPWKVFGSNEYNTLDKPQPKSVIKSFTKRLDYNRYRPFEEVLLKEEPPIHRLNKPDQNNIIESFSFINNNNIHKPRNQVLLKKEREIFTYTKCIIKTKFLLKFDIHQHIMIPLFNNMFNFIMPNNKNNIHENRTFCEINENILNSSFLNLNHYCIQSLDFYLKVKITRDDAVYNINERNIKLFYKYDNNCNEKEDYELSEISNNYIIVDL
jgi:hypothetical protein